MRLKVKNKLKMTGERVVPHDIGTPMEYFQLLRHLFIYGFLKKELKSSDRVLEVGFGEGYGTHMLSEACQEIVGIDVEKRAVEYANYKYKNTKCRFEYYDGNTIPYPDNSFETVISFQVIEHVQDDLNFITQLHRVLKKGGKLYITTPNKTIRLKPGQKPWNRFHVREYYPHELKSLLKKCFSEVNIFGISATEELHRLEKSRFRQGFLISLALRFGMRKMIPVFLDSLIARLISKYRSGKAGLDYSQGFKEQFSSDDFRVVNKKIDQSLDLFGVVVKSEE